MEMTKEEAIAKFREHWGILGTKGNGLMSKEDALEIMNEDAGINKCFLCLYDAHQTFYCDTNGCIIDWGKQNIWEEPCVDSLYTRWLELDRVLPSGREALARKISKLPINNNYTGE